MLDIMNNENNNENNKGKIENENNNKNYIKPIKHLKMKKALKIVREIIVLGSLTALFVSQYKEPIEAMIKIIASKW